MNIEDLVTILSADAVPHFDFVLFDACFMQSIEVAYALRNFTDYYIGSPTEIPGPGARYDVLVPALFSDGEVALNIQYELDRRCFRLCATEFSVRVFGKYYQASLVREC